MDEVLLHPGGVRPHNCDHVFLYIEDLEVGGTAEQCQRCLTWRLIVPDGTGPEFAERIRHLFGDVER